ncbi:hypothetical protein JCM33374_g5492 [Metschnikowia sp. JCM 33374]|nr:hypothetical protein JCM33374_g5492 [Metschnikowia sp. JCM 33374]
MSSSQSQSPATSPAKNTSANYESAAREIEQEKQMVAALKRLSLGQLMHVDPDIPASDASFSFLVDRELQPEPVVYPESPASAKSSSSSSSESGTGVGTGTATGSGGHLNSEPDESGSLKVSPKPSSKPNSRRSSTQGSIESSRQVIPDYTRPSSLGEDPRPEETLWLPANVHPEVNPQQFKNHVRTTFDEMLERKLSRSKSASRSKRSSLSFSTTDEPSLAPEKGSTDPGASAQNEKSPSGHDTAESGDIRVRNRLSNPSLRKLTSELQTMSRLAGMDSNDAVTLARSLSTSSLGYSDVERTAIGEIEHANNFPTNVSHAEFFDASDESSPPMNVQDAYGGKHHSQPPYQGYPVANTHSRGPIRSDSPHHYANGDHENFGPGPNNHPNRSQEDFSLRRSRRVDYRKSPTASSLGSQLQSNKAGKLAQLRHNLSSTSLDSSTHDIGRERLTVKQPNPRASMQSINPRSSQVLFSYNPSHHPSSGRTKSLTKSLSSTSIASKNPQASAAAVPLAGLSAKDSPYSTAITSDALGRNLHPTKYTQHKMSSKPSGSSNGPPMATSPSTSHKKYDSSASPRSGHRSSSREHEMQPNQLQSSGYRNQSNHESRDSNSSWKSHGSHSGHRKITPTSSSNQSSTVRVSPRESPVLNQGQWSEHSNAKRQPAARAVSAGSSSNIAIVSSSQQQGPRASGGHPNESTKVRSYSKREKTRELNQNLDLLRNEINEFKESLAKVDPKQPKPKVSNQKEHKAQEITTDFSFDLTNQDVSYEDTLGIEGDVLAELASTNGPSLAQSSPEHKKNLSSLGDHKKESSVPVLHSSNIVAQDSILAHPMFVQHTTTEKSKENTVPREIPRQELIIPAGDAKEEGVVRNKELDSSKLFEESKMVAESAAQAKPSEADEEFVNGVADNEAEDSKNQSRHIFTMNSQEDPLQTNEISRRSTIESAESSEKQDSKVSLDLYPGRASGTEKKRTKKNWPWSKGKSTNFNAADENNTSNEVPSPVRSVSSPEIMGSKRDAPTAREEAPGKENAISKFFKKRRSSSVSHEKSNSEQFQGKKSLDSSDSDFDQHSQGKSKGKRNSKSSERSRSEETSSQDSINKDNKRGKSNDDVKSSDDQKVSSRIKNRIKNMKKIHEEKDEKPEIQVTEVETQEETAVEEEDSKPKSTIEVQEKLKKSIKRYSRPNQPIEFTDSAFGFPLPPPSRSTLVMIDYRFPVHVERAIYRLSHLKLANPKRSLREQVILSNFMYAYLNLVDHTLHLEQQMTSDDFETEQPDGDLDFLGEHDVDTEFEADDGFEESDFESIKIDLDMKDNQISV